MKFDVNKLPASPRSSLVEISAHSILRKERIDSDKLRSRLSVAIGGSGAIFFYITGFSRGLGFPGAQELFGISLVFLLHGVAVLLALPRWGRRDYTEGTFLVAGGIAHIEKTKLTWIPASEIISIEQTDIYTKTGHTKKYSHSLMCAKTQHGSFLLDCALNNSARADFAAKTSELLSALKAGDIAKAKRLNPLAECILSGQWQTGSKPTNRTFIEPSLLRAAALLPASLLAYVLYLGAAASYNRRDYQNFQELRSQDQRAIDYRKKRALEELKALTSNEEANQFLSLALQEANEYAPTVMVGAVLPTFGELQKIDAQSLSKLPPKSAKSYQPATNALLASISDAHLSALCNKIGQLERAPDSSSGTTKKLGCQREDNILESNTNNPKIIARYSVQPAEEIFLSDDGVTATRYSLVLEVTGSTKSSPNAFSKRVELPAPSIDEMRDSADNSTPMSRRWYQAQESFFLRGSDALSRVFFTGGNP